MDECFGISLAGPAALGHSSDFILSPIFSDANNF